ncbi:hypothetical protein M1N56_08195, partial [Dehalococcoidia bacterium]|nr:hypothetical protein [Dehalococcoidia bacterium]
ILPVIILALISDESRRLTSAQVASRSRTQTQRALRTRQTSTGSSSRTASQTKQCPFCAESIQAKAIVCRYCNRELRADQYCALTICNNLIDLEANFITSDGKPVCSEQHAEMANQEEAGTSLTCAHTGCGKSLTPEMAETFKGNDGRTFCSSYHRRIA